VTGALTQDSAARVQHIQTLTLMTHLIEFGQREAHLLSLAALNSIERLDRSNRRLGERNVVGAAHFRLDEAPFAGAFLQVSNEQVIVTDEARVLLGFYRSPTGTLNQLGVRMTRHTKKAAEANGLLTTHHKALLRYLASGPALPVVPGMQSREEAVAAALTVQGGPDLVLSSATPEGHP